MFERVPESRNPYSVVLLLFCSMSGVGSGMLWGLWSSMVPFLGQWSVFYSLWMSHAAQYQVLMLPGGKKLIVRVGTGCSRPRFYFSLMVLHTKQARKGEVVLT